jgi:hypothetical protein
VSARWREFIDNDGRWGQGRRNSIDTPPMLCMPSQFHPRLVVGNDILGDMDVQLRPGLVIVPTICSIGRRHHRRQWLKHRRSAFPFSSVTTSSRATRRFRYVPGLPFLLFPDGPPEMTLLAIHSKAHHHHTHPTNRSCIALLAPSLSLADRGLRLQHQSWSAASCCCS